MADFGFYPELQLQQPDLLGQYLRGLSAPTQLAQQQQNLQAGSLQMQQLRLALQKQGMLLDLANQRSTTGEGGSADQGSASPSVGRTGGIQNGPQDAVAGPAPPPYLAANSPAAFTPAPAPQNQIGNDYSPQQLRTLSLLAPETLKSIGEARDIQIKQAQFRAQPMLNTLDTVFDSDRPAEIAMRNPDLISRWPQLARQMNLDPVSDFNDQNVRRAIALAANNIRGGVGLTAKDYPVQAQNLYGANGQFLQRNPITGEEKEVVGQKLPTFSMQPLGYDPTTGQDKSQLMITSPGGSPAPGAPSGGPGGGGGLGSMVGPQIAAYKAPTPENVKSAGFASALRGALGTMRDMEGNGFALTPSDRAQLINVASDEDPDLLHQYVSQELLSHKLSAQGQTYLTASMAAVQALSHDQSGARLNPSTIRANLEAAIPVDVKNKSSMQQIEQFRNGYYKDTLVGSGPVAYTPAFNDTLGADLRSMQSGRQLPGDFAKVSSDADYAALRPGTRFIGPDGHVRRKPQ